MAQGKKARKLLAGKGSRYLKGLAFLASAGVLAGALWGISQVGWRAALCTLCRPLPRLTFGCGTAHASHTHRPSLPVPLPARLPPPVQVDATLIGPGLNAVDGLTGFVNNAVVCAGLGPPAGAHFPFLPLVGLATGQSVQCASPAPSFWLAGYGPHDHRRGERPG